MTLARSLGQLHLDSMDIAHGCRGGVTPPLQKITKRDCPDQELVRSETIQIAKDLYRDVTRREEGRS